MGAKYQCDFCGYASDSLDDFEADFQNNRGYWCPCCDGFTYFAATVENHRFRVVFESKTVLCDGETKRLDFPTQVSPLRWPGGKSKLVGPVLERCNFDNMVNFVEPFAGGASVGLSLLLAGKVQELYINDLDYGIYALFYVIKTCPWALLEKIESFTPTKEAYKISQHVLQQGYESLDIVDAAWHLLAVNRMAFSGIPKANCMSNPAARWNKDTLKKRILNINAHAEHLHVSCMDACKFIEEMYWKSNTTIFIDPPYEAAGKSLYMKHYENDDHVRLAVLLDELYKGMPGADMLLTYDDSEYIRNLYCFPVTETIGRKYSIAN